MTLLRVTDLAIRAGDRPIVTGVDLSLQEGEALAIVGESGSGKSLTARSIIGILPNAVSASGTIEYDGRDLTKLRNRERAQFRGSEIAMIFQDPFTMLNPLMRCGEQITDRLRDENGKPLRRKARRAEARTRLEEVGIVDPDVADAYPFELSGGMRQRVGIAAAIAPGPRLLIADEPSTALDTITQREILARLRELQVSRGMSLILITHDLRVGFSMCDRVSVLYAGAMMESATTKDLEAEPRHPYTVGLLLSEPPADTRLVKLPSIPGSVPEPEDVMGSCPFAPRCKWAVDPCRTSTPPLVTVGIDKQAHLAACIRTGEIAADLRETVAVARKESDTGEHEMGETGGRTPLVVVESLSKTFGESGSRRLVRALEDVSLEVRAGECVGLVGQSGSGKSTLGRCLLGLDTPSSGRIIIDGKEATNRARLPRGQAIDLCRTIQMVFQDPYSTLNPARTIEATLSEALAVGGMSRRDRRDAVADLLVRVGLGAEYAQRRPEGLSGGERQRVAVARALAPRPRIIVCDEAVSALDVSVQAQIVNLLLSVLRNEGVSLLFITHDLAVVRQIADRIVVLHNGKIAEQGPADLVLDHPKDSYTTALLRAVPNSAEDWISTESAADDGLCAVKGD